MSNLMQELLGAPEPKPVAPQHPDLYLVKPPQDAEASEVPENLYHDVKRIRIGQYGGNLVLGLNGPAARDLTTTPAFWYHMDSAGQIPIVLQPEENIEGFDLLGQKQIVLAPKKLEGGERGPHLSDEQILDFAKKCVEGSIVRHWAVAEAEAAQKGVIVCDNRTVLPDHAFDVGPGNSDVLAASIASYVPRRTSSDE